MCPPEDRAGFTLIEIVIVIAIIGILSAVIFPNMSIIQNKAKESAIKSVGHALQVDLESYYLNKGSYPGGELTGGNLISILQADKDLGKTPTNPFTGKAYSDEDPSGILHYSMNAETGVYTLTILGSGNTNTLLTIQNL